MNNKFEMDINELDRQIETERMRLSALEEQKKELLRKSRAISLAEIDLDEVHTTVYTRRITLSRNFTTRQFLQYCVENKLEFEPEQLKDCHGMNRILWDNSSPYEARQPQHQYLFAEWLDREFDIKPNEADREELEDDEILN